MSPQDFAKKIERDRRRREDELLLLLLLLAGTAERESAVFLKHGLPINRVLSNTFLGQSGTGGAVMLIAQSMADAHRDAFRRVGLTSGEPIKSTDAGDIARIVAAYQESAKLAAQAMVNTLARAVLDLKDKSPGLTPRQVVKEAFDTSGYARSNPYALNAGVERAIVQASNAGMLSAGRKSFKDEGGQPVKIVEAFQQISVLDDRTTELCTERDHLTLDSYDPFWTWNCPPLHYGCRSILRPIFDRNFIASTRLPVLQPEPGFGVAPAGIFYL